MEAHPRTLRTVFRSDVRLTVPLFQRPYVWNAATQWQPLWEDVQATRDRGASGDAIPHFLGAIVLEYKTGAHGSLEVREVIDGQQRLTTLQLLIAAIRDTYRERFPTAVMVKRLTKLLENDPDLVELPEQRHKLWPTNRDRAGYRAVMTGEYRTSRYSPSLPLIPAAYTWFRDTIATSLVNADAEQAERELTGLAEVAFDHLEVVVIDLGPTDNAQVIFETLNARGTALRAADLIKNLLFRTLQDAGRPVEQLYERHWQALEAEAWQKDVRQGRLTRPRLDAFMGFFLVVLVQREVQAHQLLPTARSFVGNDAERALELLRETSRVRGSAGTRISRPHGDRRHQHHDTTAAVVVRQHRGIGPPDGAAGAGVLCRSAQPVPSHDQELQPPLSRTSPTPGQRRRAGRRGDHQLPRRAGIGLRHVAHRRGGRALPAAYLSGLATDLWRRPTPSAETALFVDDIERDLRPERDDLTLPSVPGPSTGRHSTSGRRDIGRHIEHVFSSRAVGEFLTIAQIRREPSPEYGESAPSAGAISARLFPPNGKTTVPGVVPETREGVRGATKVEPPRGPVT